MRESLPRKCSQSYLFDRNRHDPTPRFLHRHPGIDLSTLEIQQGPPTDVRQTEFYRRFMRPEGWDKDAEIYFWKGGSLEAYICVRRSPEQPEFGHDELNFLSDLRDAVTPCVERLRRRHLERVTTDCLQLIVARLPIPILLLDWSLDPVSFNPAARMACAEWLFGPEQARSLKLDRFGDIPPDIIQACEDERANAAAGRGGRVVQESRFAPRFRRVGHPTYRELSAEVEAIQVARDVIGLPCFLVRFQSGGNRGANLAGQDENEVNTATLARLASLSPCEREIALHIRMGLTNKDIADRLSKSVPTVKMQLQSILRKFGLHNRTQLAALLPTSTRS